MNKEQDTLYLEIASTRKRALAFIIDDMVMIFLLVVIFYDQLVAISSQLPQVLTPQALEVFQQDLNTFLADNLLLILSLKVLYHSVLVWQNGMTLGKYVMKIKVLNMNSATYPSFAQAVLRAMLRIASEVFFYLGFLLAYFTPLRQTFHDKLSSCVVVDA